MEEEEEGKGGGQMEGDTDVLLCKIEILDYAVCG
jgi:hypothetical protein